MYHRWVWTRIREEQSGILVRVRGHQLRGLHFHKTLVQVLINSINLSLLLKESKAMVYHLSLFRRLIEISAYNLNQQLKSKQVNIAWHSRWQKIILKRNNGKLLRLLDLDTIIMFRRHLRLKSCLRSYNFLDRLHSDLMRGSG